MLKQDNPYLLSLNRLHSMRQACACLPLDLSMNEILVVGAGPSGLMCAAQLLRWGLRPVIIDTNKGPTLETRALGVQARSMEIYRQMGLEQEVFSRGVPSKHASMFTERGRLGQIPMEEIGAGISRYPYMFILTQDQNEAMLAADLKKQSLEVQWETTFRALEQTDDQVTVTLETPSGTKQRQFSYVVAADGARSAVRKALNVDFAGSTYSAHKFFVADLRAEGELNPGALNLFLSNRYHVLALFPLKDAQRFRLVGLLPDDLVAHPNLTFADLQPRLREMVGNRLQLSCASWFSTYSVHHRTAAQFRVKRCFLIGDSAHVHSPVGGQGMNTGLQDAYNLAWKLALVASGRARSALLDTYEEERRPNALKLINTTDRLFNYLVSDHPFARFVIDWVLPRLAPVALKSRWLQRRFFLTFSQTALNYRARSLSVNTLSAPIQAGDRFPWFSSNGDDVFNRMSGTTFTLFAVGSWAKRVDSLAHWQNAVDVVSITDAAAARAAGLVDGLYLVRPDGYISLTCQDLDAVERYLRDTIGLSVAQSITAA
jgi:2-polyprenyl-6-methoxyphenol hydroxylase-like FAD-dependent oxidoreductase